MTTTQVFEANFTTTSPNDRLVSQLILMSSVQKYFNFNTYIACGIPEVGLDVKSTFLWGSRAMIAMNKI